MAFTRKQKEMLMQAISEQPDPADAIVRLIGMTEVQAKKLLRQWARGKVTEATTQRDAAQATLDDIVAATQP